MVLLSSMSKNPRLVCSAPGSVALSARARAVGDVHIDSGVGVPARAVRLGRHVGPAPVSTLGSHVLHVVQRSTHKQVSRVHACRCVASMAHKHARAYRAEGLLVGPSVRARWASGYGDKSVALLGPSANPQPATDVALLDLRPKSFCYCSTHRRAPSLVKPGTVTRRRAL